ncbi:quinone oxidoreductase [Seiridium cupressi]
MKSIQIIQQDGSAVPTSSLVHHTIPVLQPGFALVKIHYSAIQPSDKFNDKGGFSSTTYPRIPGRDFSGTVVGVYGTSNSELGFTHDGCNAQFCLVPEVMLAEKPQALSLSQASLVGVPYSTALRCLKKARAGPDDVVLVLGANSAVGSAAVQLARALGCKSVFRAARGCSDLVDVTLPDRQSVERAPKTLSEQISNLTSGRGVDVVVHTVGDMALMKQTIKQLAAGGRYTWIATPRDGSSTELEIDMFQAYKKELELLGCNPVSKGRVEPGEEMRNLGRLFDSGMLQPPAEDDIKIIGIDVAISEGYEEKGDKRHTVIRM